MPFFIFRYVPYLKTGTFFFKVVAQLHHRSNLIEAGIGLSGPAVGEVGAGDGKGYIPMRTQVIRKVRRKVNIRRLKVANGDIVGIVCWIERFPIELEAETGADTEYPPVPPFDREIDKTIYRLRITDLIIIQVIDGVISDAKGRIIPYLMPGFGPRGLPSKLQSAGIVMLDRLASGISTFDEGI